MTEIQRVLKQAAWRLMLIDFFRNLSVTASAAVAVLIVILIGQRVLGYAISFPTEWGQLGLSALGAAVLAAATWTMVRRARGIGLARIVDERADLRESLSTAMFVSKSKDPWADVVIESAREKAKRVDVRRAIPIVAPQLWFLPVALLLSMAILWFSLPNWDVMGRIAQRDVDRSSQFELQQVNEEMKAVKDLEEELRRRGIKLSDEEGGEEGRDAKAPLTPDEIRRAGIRRLTEMQDRMQDKLQGEDAQRLDAMKQMMRQLRVPGPGPAEEMIRQMASGNFDKAQQQLEQLAQQMASAEMSAEDQERLQEQLKQLAEQLQQLAENRKELERKLEQAGMTPEQAKKAARDPEALREAMEQMQNLTEEQKKQLAEAAKAMSEACSMCSSMGASLSQMAQGMSEAGLDQEGMKGFENMADQLSAMEMMQADFESMEASMSESMRQLAQLASQCSGSGDCDGDGECEGGGECDGCEDCQGGSPWGQRTADGSGLGQGRGTSVRDWSDVPEAPVNVQKVKSPTRQGEGPIIGTTLVQGDQIRGESVAEFASVVESSTKAAAEAIEGMQAPRELHPSIKTYFGRLEARAKAQRAREEPAAEEPSR